MNAAKALLASSFVSTIKSARSPWITAPTQVEFEEKVLANEGMWADANRQRLDYYIAEIEQVMTLTGSYSVTFLASTKPAESTEEKPNT